MIVIPIGTKAQLIKMAPVIKVLEERSLPFDFVLTGQHMETMNDLIEAFGLPKPSYSLAPIGEASSKRKLFSWLTKVFLANLRPTSPLASKGYRWCIVHGDTLSTLVAALLARFHGIGVIHVEAGLRSQNIFNPFPEELTRIAVSKLASVFFCSGETAISNINAMKSKARIVDIGENTLLDAVRAASRSGLQDGQLRAGQYCVASIHRFENLSNKHRLKFIISNIVEISKSINVYFVLHSATRHQLQKTGLLSRLEMEKGITLAPRMNYFNFIKLISNSRFLISDGGSNQEECSYLDIPCLLMRQKTERAEGLGNNVFLSNYDQEVIDSFIEKYTAREQPVRLGLERFSAIPSVRIADDLAILLRETDTP